MGPSDRHTRLMAMTRLFDLVVVGIVFVATMAISSGSFTWPGLTNILVIHIEVANLCLFGGYLVLCSVVFPVCGFYRSHRLSRWSQRLCENLIAVTVITGALLVSRQLIVLWFATIEFLLVFWLLTLC